MAKTQTWKWSLSAHKLGILKDCPRCFWLLMTKKIERPRGIFPSIPFGMDKMMKAYLDLYRGGLPPELRARIPGATLYGTVEQITKLRNWQSGLKPIVQTPHGAVGLIMSFDDIIVKDGMFCSLDTKSKGSEPEPGYSSQYYAIQADVYHLGLRECGMPPGPFAYFFYQWPQLCEPCVESWYTMRFGLDVQAITASPENAMVWICKATKLLAETDPFSGPLASDDCEYCKHHRSLAIHDAQSDQAKKAQAAVPATV